MMMMMMMMMKHNKTWFGGGGSNRSIQFNRHLNSRPSVARPYACCFIAMWRVLHDITPDIFIHPFPHTRSKNANI